MVGAILAGGAGRRMGGGKPVRMLAGRPLIAYPAAALAPVCDRTAVVCKRGTELPAGSWEVWDKEPAAPRHPAAGIAYAIGRAGGEVLVCAADMPFVTPREARSLVEVAVEHAEAVAVVARADRTQPLFAIYRAPALVPLWDAAGRGDALTQAVEGLDPLMVELSAASLRSVNDEAALAEAELELRRRAGARPGR